MQMNRNSINMVRTTISLPEDLYSDLRLMAYEQRRSISSVVVERVTRKKNNTSNFIQKSIDNDFDLFRKVALSGIRINSTQAIREERNRDNA